MHSVSSGGRRMALLGRVPSGTASSDYDVGEDSPRVCRGVWPRGGRRLTPRDTRATSRWPATSSVAASGLLWLAALCGVRGRSPPLTQSGGYLPMVSHLVTYQRADCSAVVIPHETSRSGGVSSAMAASSVLGEGISPSSSGASPSM